jgi:CDP-diacylglycerol--glycerol-3-phosphate 3-phosphatidyltransferase
MLRAPELLVLFRALCALAIVVLACYGCPGWLLAAVVIAAFVSDVFDGVVARRAGTVTSGLRYADTVIDTIFFVAAGFAVWTAVPGVFADGEYALIAIVIVHVSRTTFEMTKYGRVAAYHMWSSKALGVLLASALAWTFAVAHPTWLLTATLWLIVANELEGFAASAILPAWMNDVPTLWHAATISAARSSISSPAPSSGPRPPFRAARRVP